MRDLAGWKHLIEIVPSPANGITFDCGVTQEIGEDPVEVCRYFGSRDRINHVHFRNVRGSFATSGGFEEVLLDDGDMNMLEVLDALNGVGFQGCLNPDHYPLLEGDAGDIHLLARFITIGDGAQLVADDTSGGGSIKI